MKKLPIYLAVATIIGIVIYLLPKIISLILAILIAGIVPGTDVSINPIIMFTGAIAIGLSIMHKSIFIDLKLDKKFKKIINQNPSLKKLLAKRFFTPKSS